jgi:hypothetical protein
MSDEASKPKVAVLNATSDPNDDDRLIRSGKCPPDNWSSLALVATGLRYALTHEPIEYQVFRGRNDTKGVSK